MNNQTLIRKRVRKKIVIQVKAVIQKSFMATVNLLNKKCPRPPQTPQVILLKIYQQFKRHHRKKFNYRNKISRLKKSRSLI